MYHFNNQNYKDLFSICLAKQDQADSLTNSQR